MSDDYETLDTIQSYISDTNCDGSTNNTDGYSCVHCVDIYDLPNGHTSSAFANQFTTQPVVGSVTTIRSSMIDTPTGGQCGSLYETPVRRSHTILYEDPGSERDKIYACLEDKKIQTVNPRNVM